MPSLSFSGQPKRKRPGGWLIAVALVLVSVLILTISARVGNTGVFSVLRTGVQTVASPLQSVCSHISGPFKSLGSGSGSVSSSEAKTLKEENEQLKVLVSQLEEYRQQDQRLTTLLQLSDTYALQTVSGKVMSITSGWTHTATINVGSSDGIREGMGVMSSCGLFGQVESVTKSTCTVRMITDPNSSVSSMVQSTRATGILSGSYDGNLILDYVSVDSTVAEGDVILSSGGGGTYPQGIIIGTVSSVETDSSKLYYRIMVEPLCDPASCEEVLILTGEEDETASLLDKTFLKSILNSAKSASTSTSSTDTSATDSSTTTTTTTSSSDSAAASSSTSTPSSSKNSKSTSSESSDKSASASDKSSKKGSE